MNQKNQPITSQQTVRQQYSKSQQIWHFVLLCILSIGIYQIYWFYKSWKFFKEHNKINIYPFWRTFFMPFYAYSLFKNVFRLAEEKGYKERHSPELLTFFFIALTLLLILPNPYGLISLFSFVPLITAVKALNYFWRQEQPDFQERTGFSRGEIALLIIGGIFWILFLFSWLLLFYLNNV